MGGKFGGLVQDGDRDPEVVADLEDNLTAKAEQAVFVVRMSSLTLPWSRSNRSCLNPDFL